MEKEILKFNYPTEKPSIIKVIGVGGGGGNAVTHMYREGIRDVNFVLCNTDDQALQKSEVPVKIQLGKNVTEGLGAGNRPEKAQLAAEESAREIEMLLSDGTKMVFITAGMGGGTGTGAAPVIAKIAKNMNILTVGIVTIPFIFEGAPKIIQALKGVKKIAESVDALLVINNERLREIYQDMGATVKDAFRKADNTLTDAAKSIAETITIPGDINLDFADVRTILKDGGVAIMSSGSASGSNRLSMAIENALNSPLLNNSDIYNAKKILFNIVCSSNTPLLIDEMNEVHDFMSNFGTDIEVIWGTAIDETLEGNIKITVLATGFGTDDVEDSFLRSLLDNEDFARKEQEKKLMEEYYGKDIWEKMNKKTTPKPHLFTAEELDDDKFIDLVINNPAYNRNPAILMKQ